MQSISFCTFGLSFYRKFVRIWYLFVSIFRENDWLEKRMWTWKRYPFIVGTTLISKMKKTRWRKEYLSNVNCSFTEMLKNAQIRNDQYFLILLILFCLKSRSWSTQWVKIEYTLLCLIVGVGSNKMYQGGNYQDFLKWAGGRVFLGHSFITMKWTWGVFSQKFAICPAPTIRHKRVLCPSSKTKSNPSIYELFCRKPVMAEFKQS